LDNTFLNQSGINTIFPSVLQMKGSMLWESKDANDQNLICFQVPVVITV